jgi:hypothetical protein
MPFGCQRRFETFTRLARWRRLTASPESFRSATAMRRPTSDHAGSVTGPRMMSSAPWPSAARFRGRLGRPHRRCDLAHVRTKPRPRHHRSARGPCHYGATGVRGALHACCSCCQTQRHSTGDLVGLEPPGREERALADGSAPRGSGRASGAAGGSKSCAVIRSSSLAAGSDTTGCITASS